MLKQGRKQFTQEEEGDSVPAFIDAGRYVGDLKAYAGAYLHKETSNRANDWQC